MPTVNIQSVDQGQSIWKTAPVAIAKTICLRIIHTENVNIPSAKIVKRLLLKADVLIVPLARLEL